VCLTNDEEESHVGPGKLGELKLVMAFLQGVDEEDKASYWSVGTRRR
jgi:hypothetical protein